MSIHNTRMREPELRLDCLNDNVLLQISHRAVPYWPTGRLRQHVNECRHPAVTVLLTPVS